MTAVTHYRQRSCANSFLRNYLRRYLHYNIMLLFVLHVRTKTGLHTLVFSRTLTVLFYSG